MSVSKNNTYSVVTLWVTNVVLGYAIAWACVKVDDVDDVP